MLLKREDLNHTGSHKINNVMGQGLLTLEMGKAAARRRDGAGQHGVATATAAALFGLECVVYMGEVDMDRQELNVFRMRLLGAEVRCVRSGSRTLKDAVNEALRDWVATVESTHYCVGSVMGPHPFPWMVREFQAVIGEEARQQCHRSLGHRPRFRRRLRRRGEQRGRVRSPALSVPAPSWSVSKQPAGRLWGRQGCPGCCTA